MKRTMVDAHRLLRYAENAAKAAARAALTGGARMEKVKTDHRRDVKIAADTMLEAVIIDYLNRRTDISILSEESGVVSPRRADNAYRWIVDPLDGSLDFSRGIPLYAVSIGLWKGMTPVLGVVYDLSRCELFKGIVGIGAWLNGKPIRIGPVRSKRDAILATGFPAGTDFSQERVRRVIADIRSYKKVRWLGSAALSLAYVAAGRVDRYQEDGVKLWDVAAGLAIVKAAGGAVHIFLSEGAYACKVRAGNI